MRNLIYAEAHNELLDLKTTLKMSGLEFMTGVLTGKIPAPPIGKTLNFGLWSVEDGRVVFRGAPLFEHCNPLGTVHGGWYGTLLDSCMACSVMTKVPLGSVYTTLEFKVNIIRPIPLDMMVEAVGETDHVGRSTGVSHGVIRGVDDNRIYATGSTTCIIMKMENKPT